jgi:HprK-related kinase A
LSKTRLAAGAALIDSDPGRVAQALRTTGLCLDLGAASLRVRSDAPTLARPLQAVYRHFAFAPHAPWIDIDIGVMRPRSLRRWLRPTVVLRSDSAHPFEPFPAATALPLLEWGINWVLGQRLNHLLLLHAGAVEKGGLALLLPALPGSGKSTLTAALSLRGWRLLSDEFGAYDPQAGCFRAVLKPVALKNASIDVIRRFAPDAPIGPEFSKTRKGTVAHLAPDARAVARRHDPVRPGAFILPRWQTGSATRLESVTPHSVFGALAFNSFNYRLLGTVGFDAVLTLARRCPAWQLVYSDLDDAIASIDSLWQQVMATTRGAEAPTIDETMGA